MVKHTQTIRRQFAHELFEYVWPFYGIGAQTFNSSSKKRFFSLILNTTAISIF